MVLQSILLKSNSALTKSILTFLKVEPSGTKLAINYFLGHQKRIYADYLVNKIGMIKTLPTIIV